MSSGAKMVITAVLLLSGLYLVFYGLTRSRDQGQQWLAIVGVLLALAAFAPAAGCLDCLLPGEGGGGPGGPKAAAKTDVDSVRAPLASAVALGLLPFASLPVALGNNIGTEFVRVQQAEVPSTANLVHVVPRDVC